MVLITEEGSDRLDSPSAGQSSVGFYLVLFIICTGNLELTIPQSN